MWLFLFHIRKVLFCIIVYMVVCFYATVEFCKLCVFIVMFMYSNCYVYLFLLLCMSCSVYSVSLCCFVYCLCVNVYCTCYCHRVSTQLHLTNISYHIIWNRNYFETFTS